MSLTPMGLLQPFAPVNPTTPFTYRDNQTFLTILSNLQDKVNELVAFVNTSNAQGTSDLNTAIATLTNELNLSLQSLYAELQTQIAGSHDDSIATDPTN